MPAVVTMENGAQGGAQSDHGRDPKANGINGAGTQTPAKDAPAAAPTQVGDRPLELRPPRMNDLPDEIVHITEGFVPLSLLLTRLAQTTHNSLQDKVIELAKMPTPAGAVNGNSTHPAGDDASNENLRKKSALLSFAQEMHAKWVKALVIAEWSRKSEMVSKLIDLKWHIDQQRILYDTMLDQIVHVKRDLTYARVPSPDLKTALQVLSTGAAPWMPDLQYIEPPPLDAEEVLKWMDNVNTLLSLRLNLEEFDKIPPQFKNYTIDSGRVTFKVDGEFEVDLTIADEDFEKQLWFIDFRFSFTPAATSISESLRGYLESCVNDALAKDGLTGCYQFLHEFVLTCKINELRRQALHLSKTSWTGTLKVEPLHRALAIQYWTCRMPPTVPKSWVMIAVNSGSKRKIPDGGKPTSYLEVKWYRDGKVVTDVDLTLDIENLSAETLLRNAIGHHIEFILRGIHDKLLETPRFRKHELRISLDTSYDNPAESRLHTQVAHSTTVSLLMEPKTGVFAIKPSSKFTVQQEHRLNNGPNHIEGGFLCLEDVRCAFMEDEIYRRSGPLGWLAIRPAIKDDELRSMTKIRDWTRVIWLQRKGWTANWSLVVVLSLSGDEWLLVETSPEATRAQRSQVKLPLGSGPPDLSDQFWHGLTILSTALISQNIDKAVLHRQEIWYRPSERLSMPTRLIRMPALDISLAAIFPTMVRNPSEDPNHGVPATALGDQSQALTRRRPATSAALSPRQAWARDIVSVQFKMLQAPSRSETHDGTDPSAQRLLCVSEAIVQVRKSAKLATLKGRVDRTVHYDHLNGEFYLLLRHPVGEPILDVLKSRIVAIDRFVCFLEALEKCKGTIESEDVSLRGVSFFYGQKPPQGSESHEGAPAQRLRVGLDLSKDEVDVRLEKGNPHLRVMDIMKALVNLDGGISTLMSWLPTSLPTMTAIDAIDTAWEDIQARAQGCVEIVFRTIDWMAIRYTITGTNDAGQRVPRRLILEARVRIRQNELWWHIWRYHRNNNNNDRSNNDRFDAALKPVWDGRGKWWQGFGASAAGRTSDGAATMLHKIDEAIRGLVGDLDGDEGFASTQPPQNQQLPQQPPQPPQPSQQPRQQQQQHQQQQKKKPQPKSGKGPDQAIEIG